MAERVKIPFGGKRLSGEGEITRDRLGGCDNQLVPHEGTVSGGSIEGLNDNPKVTFGMAYALRTLKATEIALYHALGKLPEPEFTHRFF